MLIIFNINRDIENLLYISIFLNILNQYNTAVLADKDKLPILTDKQLAERIATPGNVKHTKSGIYLVQN